MACCLFLCTSHDNTELCTIFQHNIDPKCREAQTVKSEQWLKQLHLGKRYAHKMFFIWVSKVFNITNENILRMCNHFLEVQQSEYDNISMNTIFFILRSWNEVNEIYFKYSSSLWYIRWKSQDYFMKIDLAFKATFMDNLFFRWNRRIKIYLKAKYCVRYFKITISQKMYYFKMDFLKKCII